MNTSDSISLKDLRRRLFELLDTLPEDSTPVVESVRQPAGPLSKVIQNRGGKHPTAQEASVVKAIPVAFPVVEVTYTLRERVPEPIGLIRRAVLQAVCEFGPCSSQYIDELLAIGADVVERTLVDLTISLPDLVQRGTEFTAGPKCSQLLKSGGFSRLVTHERKFVVNGLTDKLLPIDFWRKHKGLRLFPNPSDPNGPMCTESGTPTPVAAKIVDRGVTGRDHLKQLVRNGDATSRQSLGLPAGACELPEDPSAIHIAWVLSFLMVRADASVELLSARRNATVLLGRNVASKEYLRHVCQGMEAWILNVGAPTQPSEKWCDRWPEGTKVEQGATHGEVVVTLAEPMKLLRFDMDASVKDKSGRLLLEQGRDWNPHTFKICRIVPGDLATARATALIRGIRELRFILRPFEASANTRPPINLAEWWLSWLADFGSQGGLELPVPFITVDQLLNAADQVNDTEFQDKLEWLLR
jgi:hypothetical protein